MQSLIYFYNKDPNLAENELKTAIEKTDEPLAAQMQLCRLYAQTKRLSEAISECRSICNSEPNTAEPWLYLSNLYISSKDYKQAEDCLRQAQEVVVSDKDKRSISTSLAVLMVTHGDRPAGIKILSDLAERDKKELRARALLLNTREILQDPAKAQKLINEVKDIEGDTGLTWRLYQSVLWLSSNDWRAKQQDISAYLQYCIDSDPKSSAPVLLLVNLYEKLQDWKKAEDVCRQALIRNPSAFNIINTLVAILENHGRFADVEKVLEQSGINPQFANVWHNARLTGDFSKAIEELKLILSTDNKDAGSRIRLAMLIYSQYKDPNEAFVYLNEAQAIEPNSPDLIVAKVSILNAEGQTGQAQKILNDYVEKNNTFVAYGLRGEYYVYTGDLERAEQDYRKLITFEDQGTAGYIILDNFYINNNMLDKAVETLEESPGDLQLKKLLISSLFKRNQNQDREEAFSMLAALEKEYPQDTDLMRLRAEQLLKENTLESVDKAKEIIKKIVALEPASVYEYLTLIDITIKQNDYKQARDYVVQAIGANPGNLALISARSKVELGLGNTQTAMELADSVLKKAPNNIDAINVFVSAAIDRKDKNLIDKAENYLESAIKLNPENESLLISQAQFLSKIGKTSDAIKLMEDYSRTDKGSKSIAALITIADLYRLSGDREHAKQNIDKAELVDPNSQAVKDLNPALLVTAAQILLSMNSAELNKEALAFFRKGCLTFSFLV